MKITSAVMAAGFTLACGPALAWNGFGHMEVAAVAWDKLTPTARGEAAALLRLNPQYVTWTRGVRARQRGHIAFVMAATWPDFIKSASGYQSDGPQGGNAPPPGRKASRNIGYADKLMHKYWHFIDEPFSPDDTKLQAPSSPNAQTQIAAFRAKVSTWGGATKTAPSIRSYDVAWLLHLVGDIHQPLHATSRFTKAHPDGDQGGNLVTIHCGDGCRDDELHAFWDDVLGTSTHPRDAIKAASALPEPDAAAASTADEKRWIAESFSAAQAEVYVAPIDVGAEPFTLNDAYKSAALTLAKQRVALAGTRLANLLNAALRHRSHGTARHRSQPAG
jgi:hypothetical protein